jgi:hypothetical protein
MHPTVYLGTQFHFQVTKLLNIKYPVQHKFKDIFLMHFLFYFRSTSSMTSPRSWATLQSPSAF